MNRRLRIASLFVMVGVFAGSFGMVRADNPLGLPAVCGARGKMIVNEYNQVNFGAAGTCGAFNVGISIACLC